jgi:hypothetical protein
MVKMDPVPGAPSDNTTVSVVLADLAEDGWDGSFTPLEDGRLRCNTCREELAPHEAEIHALRRLEGASDPADMVAVVSLRCPRCGARGSMVLGYGPDASAEDSDVLSALEDADTHRA